MGKKIVVKKKAIPKRPNTDAVPVYLSIDPVLYAAIARVLAGETIQAWFLRQAANAVGIKGYRPRTRGGSKKRTKG